MTVPRIIERAGVAGKVYAGSETERNNTCVSACHIPYVFATFVLDTLQKVTLLREVRRSAKDIAKLPATKMLIKLFYLLLTILSVQSEQPRRDGRSLLKYKEGVKFLSNDTVPVQTNNFLDLMKQCKVFIDHSLFIQEVLKAGYALLTTPSKWGKSVNMDMLRLFLEIQLDSEGNKIMPVETTPNYKMFTTGEILLDDGREVPLIVELLINFQVKLVQEKLGKNCVLFLNFSDTIAPDYDSAIQKVGLAVNREFKRHQYMIKVLEKRIQILNEPATNKLLQQFKTYLYIDESKPINETTIIDSFRFLCELMFQHYHKRVYILIDDYDRPIHGYFQYESFDGVQADKMLRFMNIFMRDTIEDKLYRERDIITGTFFLAINTWTHVWYAMSEARTRPHGYFGFNYENTKAFLYKFNIPQELWPKVEKWYGGYKPILKRCTYQQTSLIKYITAKEFQCFRKNESNSQFIQKVIRTTPYWRDNMLRLISKQSIYLRNRPQYKRMLENLTDVWHDDGTTLKVYGEYISYLYLLAEGYVIELPDSVPERRCTNYVKLPNLENAYALADWMISYYKTTYQIDEKHLDNAALTLYNFSAPDNNETSPLQQSLTELYKHSTLLATEPNKQPNTDSAHAILYCVGLQMQCLKKFEHEVYYNRTKNGDMVIIDEPNTYGVIIELRYSESSADEALQAAETHKGDVFRLFGITAKLRLVGIHLAQDKTLKIASKLVYRNVDN